MKSYQIQTSRFADSVWRIKQVADALNAQGHIVVSVRPGAIPSITVKPSPATRLLDSVCTGQGGVAGHMYRSYAAIVEGVKIVWHKPIRATNIIYWPELCRRRSG